MTVLYTNKNGKIRVWQCFVDGDAVITVYGELGGKQARKEYKAKPKNVGRSNETTAEEQACIEVEAKVVYQEKHGYFRSVEEAESYQSVDPMKCQDMKDHGHKITYPHYISPKMDGLRMMIDKNGDALSKAGEVISVPEHWVGYEDVAKIWGGLDGEVFNPILSLQAINSAFKKKNDNTPLLLYYVYDIPMPNTTFAERAQMLMNMKEWLISKGYNWCVVVPHTLVHNQQEFDSLYTRYLEAGYEGIVSRNLCCQYEFGKRSYDMQKKKPRFDAEATVISVTMDRNRDGVMLCEAINGVQKGVTFECLMRKDADSSVNYRKYDNAIHLIGKTISYAYEELGDDKDGARGKPLKPVGVAIREIDEHFKG